MIHPRSLGLWLALYAAAGAQNLIPDGGFENGTFAYSCAQQSILVSTWFGTGGDANVQLEQIFRSAPPFEYELRAWPLLYGTLLSSGGAVVLGLVLSTLVAVFIVEFAPPSVTRVLEPVVRLLAGVPSVIYGLLQIESLPGVLRLMLLTIDYERRWVFLFLLLLPVALTMTLIWKIKDAIFDSVFRREA